MSSKDASDEDGDSLALKIIQIHQMQCDINTRFSHMERNFLKFSKAFPGDDIDGHRRYHEAVIAMMEEKRKMYANIKEKTMGGLVWFLVITVCSWLAHELRLPAYLVSVISGRPE